MIGKSFINTEDSISIDITADKIDTFFVKGHDAYKDL